MNEKTKMKIKPTLNSLSTESFLLDNDLISFSKSLLFKLISFIFLVLVWKNKKIKNFNKKKINNNKNNKIENNRKKNKEKESKSII